MSMLFVKFYVIILRNPFISRVLKIFLPIWKIRRIPYIYNK
ncbi:hypothetical protein [Staphylococcus phage vB_SauM-V1SA20]|nr:hypothetical protein [Staphylococcus phage vB_SauM-V1SA20]